MPPEESPSFFEAELPESRRGYVLRNVLGQALTSGFFVSVLWFTGTTNFVLGCVAGLSLALLALSSLHHARNWKPGPFTSERSPAPDHRLGA